MQCARLALVCLATAAGMFAADQFAGTWKMNTAKSKFARDQPPKEQTVTIAESGTDLDITVKGTSADGTPRSAHFTVPAAGGDGKVIDATDYDAVSGKRGGPDRLEVAFTKEGKLVMTVNATVARDGRVMTANLSGTDSEGKPTHSVEVYDLQ